MKRIIPLFMLAVALLLLVACTVPVAEEAQAPTDSSQVPVAEGPVSAEIASTAGLDEALEQLDLVE